MKTIFKKVAVVMESGNHFKNGKSQTSRRNRLSAIKHLSVVLITSALILSGCASIVTKSAYPIAINSNPTNARVSITDKYGRDIYVGNTPATVTLKAGDGFFTKAEYRVKFSTDGYEDRIVTITPNLDGWFFGNIFLGGIIGIVVDGATGAMWKIAPNSLNETLGRAPTASFDLEIQFFDINDIPENWKNHLAEVN